MTCLSSVAGFDHWCRTATKWRQLRLPDGSTAPDRSSPAGTLCSIRVEIERSRRRMRLFRGRQGDVAGPAVKDYRRPAYKLQVQAKNNMVSTEAAPLLL